MFSEKKLEDMIFNKLQKHQYDFFESRGIDIPNMQKWYRQVNLAEYGIADIIGFSLKGTPNMKVLQVVTIELKIVAFEGKNISQVKRYTSAIAHFLKSLDMEDDVHIEYNNIIITSDDDPKSDDVFFLNFNNDCNLSIYFFSYTIEKGISFRRVDSDGLDWYKNRFTPNSTSLNMIQSDMLKMYSIYRKQSRKELKERIAQKETISQEDLMDLPFFP
jgi:hypothetical protein